MKVLRVIPSLNPRVGGPAVAGLNSVISLSRSGVEAEIAVIVRPRERTASWWGELEDRCAHEGVRLRSFPTTTPWLTSNPYDPSAALTRWLFKQPGGRYDLIHVESPWTGACAIASMYAAYRSIPLVLSPNAVFMPPELSKGRVPFRAAKGFGLRAYARVASTVVCSSALEARDAARSGVSRRKLTWIYHAVVDDLVPFQASAQSRSTDGLRVGYLGRLHPVKNVELLIDAIGQVGGDMTLQVAGRGDTEFEADLMRRARQLLGERAQFNGWVDESSKAAFFAGNDVLVMPSQYECFGVAAVESLAAGVPVIVSDRAGVADIVRTHRVGTVVPPTVTGISGALRRYRDDRRALAADRSSARHAALAESGFAAHARRLLAAYGRVLERRT